MKIFPASIYSAILLISIPNFLLSQDITDLYFKGDISTVPSMWEHGYLGESNSWNVGAPDGPSYGKKPTSSDNLWISGSTTAQSGFVTGWVGDMYFRDINFDLTLSASSFDLLSNIENQTINSSGNINVNINKINNDWTRSINILVEDDSAYKFAGDFTFSSHRATLSIINKPDYGPDPYPVVNISKNGSFSVGGDFKINNKMNDSGQYEDIVLKTNLNNFSVGGIMDLTQKENNTIKWELKSLVTNNTSQITSDVSYDSNITLGGLRGTGSLAVTDTYAGENGRELYIEFQNKTAEEWRGNFTNNSGVKTNVIMFGDSNGKQTLKLLTGKFDTVSVSGGTLNLYTTEANGKLIINGQNAVFGLTGYDSEDFSYIEFDEVEWKNGTIKMNIIAEGMTDFIKVNGAFNVYADSSSVLKLDLELTAYDLNSWLEETDAEYIDFDLISFTETNVDVSDIVVTVDDGILCDLIVSGNYLTARLSNVPEPSTYAALFGVFSICLSALAKRRRR